jgi:hypothetical protein
LAKQLGAKNFTTNSELIMTQEKENTSNLKKALPVLVKKLCLLNGCSVPGLLRRLVVAEAKRYGLIEARGLEG